MSAFPQEYRFLSALCAGLAVALLVLQPAEWYLVLILLAAFAGVVFATRSWPGRGFYLVCCGAPLLAASGIVNLWAGLYAAVMVAGTICTVLGLLESRRDFETFLTFSACAFLIALLVVLSNHVLLPLAAIAGVMVIVLAVQSVRTYQFRKQYSGAER